MAFKLIVPIDFSPYSERLLQFAEILSNNTRCEIQIIHQIAGAVPALTDATSRSQILAHEKEQAKISINLLVQKCLTPGKKVTQLITDRKLLTVLKEIANSGKGDVVLTGLKGTGFIKKVLIGSEAQKMISELDTIIVAIPMMTALTSPKNLLVAVSPKFPLNHEKFGDVLQNLIQSVKSISFFSILKEDANEREVQDYMESLKSRYNPIFNVSSKILLKPEAFEEIKKEANLVDDAFLVLQKGSRTLTDQLFREYLTDKLIYDGSLPLIILP
jgi:nucleotide-binding universal stress UspA family protein